MIFDLQLFGGKGTKITTTQASVPQATPEERALLNEQLRWTQATMPVAQNLLNQATNALNTQQVVPNPNWQTLYNNAQAQTNQANSLVQSLIPSTQASMNSSAQATDRYSSQISNATNQMNRDSQALAGEFANAIANNQDRLNGLWNGELPSSYSEARQKALQSDLDNTVGNTLSNLASRGIINSSQADSAFNDISKNASNALASQYTNDMNTVSNLANQMYSSDMAGVNSMANLWDTAYKNSVAGIGENANLANQQYNNNLQGVSSLSQLANQYQQMGMMPISTAATAQEAATNQPLQYLAMATGQNAPTANLLSQLSSQRYSVATPGQTVVNQGGNGLLGGIFSGLGSYFACFVDGTEVATPSGAVNITDIKAGDEVVSLGAIETVEDLKDMGEKPTTVLEVGRFTVETTDTEVFNTPEGNKPLTDIHVGDEIMTVDGYERVKAITPTGTVKRVYELIVTGSNMFYANGILAEGLTHEEVQSVEGITEKPLEDYTKVELQALAKEKGVTYTPRTSKKELIALLEE